MIVYIDGFVDYGKRIGGAGPRWCHLIAESLPELHDFAQKIGLKKSWFQDHSIPHYDIGTKRIRDRALGLGAVEMSTKQNIKLLRRLREVI